MVTVNDENLNAINVFIVIAINVFIRTVYWSYAPFGVVELIRSKHNKDAPSHA